MSPLESRSRSRPGPAPGAIFAEVNALVLDEDGQPVADTRRISFTVGKTLFGDSALTNGLARIYLQRDKSGQVAVSVRCGRATASTQVTFAPAKVPVVQFRLLRKGSRAPVPMARVKDDWREGIGCREPRRRRDIAAGNRPPQLHLRRARVSPPQH